MPSQNASKALPVAPLSLDALTMRDSHTTNTHQSASSAAMTRYLSEPDSISAIIAMGGTQEAASPLLPKL
ncbi:hypothetical protein D7B24_004114 [Verticillium nonalfalfae]|uniref:Uncharacterized protein n=1 Tax=Verticillium nonalfalfae TaxID=1051616 RepID=A0A3M9YF96_9PEZI|nr:uncharacterized protein D7B24_004114 [Verticillium nonalfalfae]RNJ58751.1 hypothetical protein D7B24_004114 [Verticillium nonalfalfae]